MSKDASLAQQPSRMHFTLRRHCPRGCRPRRHRAPLHSHLAASLNCQPAPPPPLQALRLFVALPALSSSAIPLELHVLFVYQPRSCGCGVERDRSDILIFVFSTSYFIDKVSISHNTFEIIFCVHSLRGECTRVSTRVFTVNTREHVFTSPPSLLGRAHTVCPPT